MKKLASSEERVSDNEFLRADRAVSHASPLVGVRKIGSGKSSLLATLFRTVNLCDGQILLDNVDTTTMERRSLR